MLYGLLQAVTGVGRGEEGVFVCVYEAWSLTLALGGGVMGPSGRGSLQIIPLFVCFLCVSTLFGLVGFMSNAFLAGSLMC